MGGTDSRAGQHGNRQFRDHGHVDSHPVSLFDTKALEHIGEFAHFFVQLLIGESLTVSGLTFPDEGYLILPRSGKVSVKTVIAHVQLSVDKPLGPWRVPFKDFIPFLEPVQFFCKTGPESLKILFCFLIYVLVFHPCCFSEIFRWGEQLSFF